MDQWLQHQVDAPEPSEERVPGNLIPERCPWPKAMSS